MSEEENKAIETLKNRTGFRLDYKCKNCGSGGLTIIPSEVLYGKEIDIALNYIATLQKENQELKETDLTSVYMKGFYDSKSKWKEKVKNKIKELDETKQYWTEDVIDILDELLEE